MNDKYKEFYESYEWRKVRYGALIAADGKCQLCGRSKHDGIILNVDHIVSLRTNWKLRAAISNLQVLCHECNHGKGNRDKTDWRNGVPALRKPKKKNDRKKRKAKKEKLERQAAMDRYKYGRMGAGSGLRIISIDEWLSDQVKRRHG